MTFQWYDQRLGVYTLLNPKLNDDNNNEWLI